MKGLSSNIPFNFVSAFSESHKLMLASLFLSKACGVLPLFAAELNPDPSPLRK
jgi:hypothetical protein